jgi:predicted small metal-binding protein
MSGPDVPGRTVTLWEVTAMAQQSAKCPVCGGELNADTRTALVGKLQKHGKEKHGMDITEQQAKDIIQKPAA